MFGGVEKGGRRGGDLFSECLLILFLLIGDVELKMSSMRLFFGPSLFFPTCLDFAAIIRSAPFRNVFVGPWFCTF